MEVTEPVLESANQPDILDDEMKLKWGVSPQEFEQLGKQLLAPFQKATKFSLVLSGRIVPTNTYVNVWEIPSASAVQAAWATLGKADQGDLSDWYVKLNDMLLEEKQEILFALKQERRTCEGDRVIYLRNQYWVEPENLRSFIDDVRKSEWSGGASLVGFGLAFTGKLNVFTVYIALPAKSLKFYPEPGAYSRIEEVLEVFDQMVVAKQIRFHAIRYRPSAPQVLVPTSFDPSVYAGEESNLTAKKGGRK
jgi:hypothetical protein